MFIHLKDNKKTPKLSSKKTQTRDLQKNRAPGKTARHSAPNLRYVDTRISRRKYGGCHPRHGKTSRRNAWGRLLDTAATSKKTARLVKYRAPGKIPRAGNMGDVIQGTVKLRAEIRGVNYSLPPRPPKKPRAIPHQISGMSIRGSRDTWYYESVGN